jgi:BASS family bile acid:Na+ symporter
MHLRRLLSLLRHRDAILVLALLTGLGAGQGAPYTESLVLPALALVMTLAVMGVPLDIFRTPRNLVSPTLLALAANYALLGGLLLALSRLCIGPPDLRNGFVLLAIVPPAVAVIPFTYILGGDRILSLVGTVSCYLGALVLTPVGAWLLLGGGILVHRQKIAGIVAQLILLPLLLATLLQRLGWHRPLEPYKGTITNWSFFLITYTIVGLNRQLFLQRPGELLPVMAIAVATTFLWGEIITWWGRRCHVDPSRLTSLVLLGTLKNYGLAGGLALSLFSPQTSVPAAVSTVFMIVYVIWLNFRQHSRPPKKG